SGHSRHARRRVAVASGTPQRRRAAGTDSLDPAVASIALDAGGDAGGMVSALEQSAVDLEGELSWLGRLIDARFKLYFNLDDAEADAVVQPPDLSESDSPYAMFLREIGCDFGERVALVLALTPHLRPQILDVFFTRNQTFDRRFTEFGGARQDAGGEF